MITFALWLALNFQPTVTKPATIEQDFFPGYQYIPNAKDSQDKDPEVKS